MVVTKEMKKHFCENIGITVSIYTDPYFEDRLELFGVSSNWKKFLNTVETKFKGSFGNYMDEYNAVQRKVKSFIQESEAYRAMIASKSREFKIEYDACNNSINTDDNIGNKYISISIPKPQYTSIIIYSKLHTKFFTDAISYEELMKRFTDIELIQISVQMYNNIMEQLYDISQDAYIKLLLKQVISKVASEYKIGKHNMFSSDYNEILISTDGFNTTQIKGIRELISNTCKPLPVSFEYFELGKIIGTDIFIRCEHCGDFKEFIKDIEGLKFNVQDSLLSPFVYRKAKNDKPKDVDSYFDFNDRVAKLIEPIQIEFDFKQRKRKEVNRGWGMYTKQSQRR